MRQIILVANNMKKKPILLANHPEIKKGDIIVRFGKCFMVENDVTDIFILRQGATGYSGTNPANNRIIRNDLLKPRTTFWAINNKYKDLVKDIEKVNNIKIKKILSGDDTKKNWGLSCPSSGMVALDYFLTNYKDWKIRIVNFSWEGWHGHEWYKEKQIFQNLIKNGKVEILGISSNKSRLNTGKTAFPIKKNPILRRPINRPIITNKNTQIKTNTNMKTNINTKININTNMNTNTNTNQNPTKAIEAVTIDNKNIYIKKKVVVEIKKMKDILKINRMIHRTNNIIQNKPVNR